MAKKFQTRIRVLREDVNRVIEYIAYREPLDSFLIEPGAPDNTLVTVFTTVTPRWVNSHQAGYTIKTGQGFHARPTTAKELPPRTEGALLRLLGDATQRLETPNRWGEFSHKMSTMTLADRLMLTESIGKAAGWMRLGYRMAGLRYQGLDKRRLVEVFRNVKDAVEVTLNAERDEREDRSDVENGVLIVRIDAPAYSWHVSFEMSGTVRPRTTQENDEIDRVREDEFHPGHDDDGYDDD